MTDPIDAALTVSNARVIIDGLNTKLHEAHEQIAALEAKINEYEDKAENVVITYGMGGGIDVVIAELASVADIEFKPKGSVPNANDVITAHFATLNAQIAALQAELAQCRILCSAYREEDVEKSALLVRAGEAIARARQFAEQEDEARSHAVTEFADDPYVNAPAKIVAELDALAAEIARATQTQETGT